MLSRSKISLQKLYLQGKEYQYKKKMLDLILINWAFARVNLSVAIYETKLNYTDSFFILDDLLHGKSPHEDLERIERK